MPIPGFCQDSLDVLAGSTLNGLPINRGSDNAANIGVGGWGSLSCYRVTRNARNFMTRQHNHNDESEHISISVLANLQTNRIMICAEAGEQKIKFYNVACLVFLLSILRGLSSPMPLHLLENSHRRLHFALLAKADGPHLLATLLGDTYHRCTPALVSQVNHIRQGSPRYRISRVAQLPWKCASLWVDSDFRDAQTFLRVLSLQVMNHHFCTSSSTAQRFS